MQRSARMFCAPGSPQNMPDCLQRAPMTVLHPASTTEPSTNWRLAWLNLGCFDLILHAVTLALDNHRFGVVQEPVQHGAGQGAVVVEDFGPMFIGLIRGQQDGALLVTLADDLEEQVRAGFVDGQVA